LSRVKSLDGPRVRVISPIGKEKVHGGKDLLKTHVLSWDTVDMENVEDQIRSQMITFFIRDK